MTMTTTTSTMPAREPFATPRILLLVFGGLVLLASIALIAVGGVSAWALGERDGAGYLNTSTHTFSSGERAIVSDNLDLDDTPRWVGDHLATVRIEARSTEPVFVGIARTNDVERYLAGVGHDRVTDFDTDPFVADYESVAGTREPASPAGQDFWRVQASGSGSQTIAWPLEDGDWSVVAMNADGSRDVEVDARFGARIDALGWIAAAFLAAGGLVLLGGATLVYFGARSPRHD
jgi:hypothetical protein